MGNLLRCLAHLLEVAPLVEPRCLPVLIRADPHATSSTLFSAHLDVAPGTRAKVALVQVRQLYQRTLQELTPADVKKITGWVTQLNLLGLPMTTPAHLRFIFQRTGNIAPPQDRL